MRAGTIILITAIAMVAGTLSARADQQLLESCRNYVKPKASNVEVIKGQHCESYVNSFFDGWFWAASFNNRSFLCTPLKVTKHKLAELLLNWASNNPHLVDQNNDVSLWLALSDAYYCPEGVKIYKE